MGKLSTLAAKPGTARVRVLIAGRHTAFLDGVTTLLDARDEFQVTRAAEDTAAVLNATAENVPEVVITSVKPGDGVGLNSIRLVRKRSPNVRFVVISGLKNPVAAIDYLKAGADACLSIHCTSEELMRAVRQVSLGRSYLDPDFASSVIRRAAGSEPETAALLTRRELTVLKLLAMGGTNKQIAHALTLSVNTVKTRLARIYEKLGVTSRAHAVAFGIKERIIDLE